MITGDQGFLNSYYVGFANAHVYEPNLPSDVLNSRKVPEMERLSTLYNADVGLYMLANKVFLRFKRLPFFECGFSWFGCGVCRPFDQNLVKIHLLGTLEGRINLLDTEKEEKVDFHGIVIFRRSIATLPILAETSVFE